MVVILYGMPASPPVRAVVLTLKAIGLEYEFREVNLMTGDHMKPEYLAKNPQHTVPTLEDDGKYIWDSHAIIPYLVEKYAKNDSLYPKDYYLRAVVNQRLHFETGVLSPKLGAIIGPLFRGGANSIPADKVTEVEEAYAFLETFLGKNNYLAGNQLTVADFSILATLSSGQAVAPIDAGKFPKLSAWFERLQKLPYYEEANGKGAAFLIGFIKSKLK